MMSKKTKLYLVSAIVLLAALGTGWYYLNNSSASQEGEDGADYQYQVSQPQLISYSKGDKRWQIRSKTIIQPKLAENKELRVILKEIEEGRLYGNDNLEYKVDAERIVYFEKTKDINLYGNIKLSEALGDTIFAQQLSWDEQAKNLTTKSGVRVEMEDGQLWAQKMDLDLERKVIDFTGDVRMTFQVREAQGDEE